MANQSREKEQPVEQRGFIPIEEIERIKAVREGRYPDFRDITEYNASFHEVDLGGDLASRRSGRKSPEEISELREKIVSAFKGMHPKYQEDAFAVMGRIKDPELSEELSEIHHDLRGHTEYMEKIKGRKFMRPSEGDEHAFDQEMPDTTPLAPIFEGSRRLQADRAARSNQEKEREQGPLNVGYIDNDLTVDSVTEEPVPDKMPSVELELTQKPSEGPDLDLPSSTAQEQPSEEPDSEPLSSPSVDEDEENKDDLNFSRTRRVVPLKVDLLKSYKKKQSEDRKEKVRETVAGLVNRLNPTRKVAFPEVSAKQSEDEEPEAEEQAPEETEESAQADSEVRPTNNVAENAYPFSLLDSLTASDADKEKPKASNPSASSGEDTGRLIDEFMASDAGKIKPFEFDHSETSSKEEPDVPDIISEPKEDGETAPKEEAIPEISRPEGESGADETTEPNSSEEVDFGQLPDQTADRVSEAEASEATKPELPAAETGGGKKESWFRRILGGWSHANKGRSSNDFSGLKPGGEVDVDNNDEVI